MSWIKIDRKIFDHWITDDAVKFKRWILMLSEVNWKPSKYNIGNKIYDIPVGSSTKSLRTWSRIFDCSVNSVTSFFNLLESDGMIERKTIGIGKHSTTLVKITNYEQYQSIEKTLDDTQIETLGDTRTETQKEHKKGTEEEVKTDRLKEGKNNNSNGQLKIAETKFNFKSSLIESGANKDLVSDWLAVRRKKKAYNTPTALKGFIREVNKSHMDINQAIQYCVEHSWSGFKAEWVENKSSNNGKSQPNNINERNKRDRKERQNRLVEKLQNEINNNSEE